MLRFGLGRAGSGQFLQAHAGLAARGFKEACTKVFLVDEARLVILKHLDTILLPS
jgi:hypothetical protein